jgi:hypothetical protein
MRPSVRDLFLPPLRARAPVYGKNRSKLVLLKFSSVQFSPEICEPRTGPWFRFDSLVEPWTGPLRTGSKWSGSGSELVRTSKPLIIFVNFQEKNASNNVLLKNDRRMSTRDYKLSLSGCLIVSH